MREMSQGATVQQTTTPAISVSGGVCRYPNQRGIGPLTVEFASGEVCSLLGANGSGKTTLLRCLAGFERLDSGKLVAPPSCEIGIVFQNLEPWPHLRVWENIAVPLRHGLRLNEPEIHKRVEEELKRFGIQDRSQAMPFQLSGGIRQRVVLARAFALRPRILLLDEATSALDPEWTERVREIIRQFVNEGGTVVCVSHRINWVRRVSDTIIFLSNGFVVESGPSNKLLNAPTDVRFVRFLENA